MARLATSRPPLFLALWALCAAPAGAAGPDPARFRNVAGTAGLRFVLDNYHTAQKFMIETMLGGVATFDYNNDGRTDIFFTNGAELPSHVKTGPRFWNRLYRNDGGMKFTDVTEETGLAGAGYSMGAAAADYDNDGLVDLFVAGVRVNRLYHNLGNGKFQDVTLESGIQDDWWAVAAQWLDYDNDGQLDLWITHYTKWPPMDRFCGDRLKDVRVYCHPKYFTGLPNRLFHNLGKGKFAEATRQAGLEAFAGRGMGIGISDYDRDGFIDVFVTNDNEPNFLFHNLGNGKFEETGLLAGVALLDHGKPVASMGPDFRDYDNDGWPDIVYVDLYGETFPLFQNTRQGGFRDYTYLSRLGKLSARLSAWGPGLFDFNLDGWKDLFISCAHVNDRVEMFEFTSYKLSNAIFLNDKGIFFDGTPLAGDDFQLPRVHRGLAFADFNNDGLIDAVVSVIGEAAELWENVTPTGNDWLIVRLEGVQANRDGIGAVIRWGNQWNIMASGSGYASSSHFGVHFGAPKGQAPDTIEILWPGGRKQTVSGVQPRQVLRVKQGG